MFYKISFSFPSYITYSINILMSMYVLNIGGDRGFNKVIWTVKEKGGGDFPYITLYYHSFDGEEGT